MLEVVVAIATSATGFATFVLAFITWRYVRLTKDILEENRQMRIDAQKPKIAIAPHCTLMHDRRTTLIYLLIENIGLGPAYDVQFETDLNFMLNVAVSLRDVYILREGINYLKSGGQKSCLITPNEIERQKGTPLKIAVAYKDRRNKTHRESFCLDFNEVGGVLDAIPK